MCDCQRNQTTPAFHDWNPNTGSAKSFEAMTGNGSGRPPGASLGAAAAAMAVEMAKGHPLGDASVYGAGKLAPPDAQDRTQSVHPIYKSKREVSDTMRAIQRNQIIAAKLAQAEDTVRELRRLQGLLDEYNIDHLTDLVTLLQKHGL